MIKSENVWSWKIYETFLNHFGGGNEYLPGHGFGKSGNKWWGVSSVPFSFWFPFQLHCELVSSGISSQSVQNNILIERVTSNERPILVLTILRFSKMTSELTSSEYFELIVNWFLNLLVRNVIEREIEREKVHTDETHQ